MRWRWVHWLLNAYLKAAEGWLHLATVIDLATRMVVGWQMRLDNFGTSEVSSSG